MSDETTHLSGDQVLAMLTQKIHELEGWIITARQRVVTAVNAGPYERMEAVMDLNAVVERQRALKSFYRSLVDEEPHG